MKAPIAEMAPGAARAGAPAGEREWTTWADGYGLAPEYDNSNQLHFYVDADWAQADGVVDEAEDMGATIDNTQDGSQWIIYTGETGS